MSIMFNHEHKKTADWLKREIDPRSFYYEDLPNAKLDRYGWNYGQVCCFHDDDKSGSLRVNLETGAFKCVSCGVEENDIIDFTIAKDKIQMAEALAQLEFIWLPG